MATKPKAKTPTKRATQPRKRGELLPNFKIEDLNFDEELQGRDFVAGKDGVEKGQIGFLVKASHVEDIQQAVKAKRELPPIRVFQVKPKEGNPDTHEGNYVTNGHHELEAYYREGRKTVPIELFRGTWFDACLDATAANKEHDQGPLKRTNEDKRKAVKKLLATLDAAGENWTDTRIAEHVGVGADTVRRIKLEIRHHSLAEGAPRKGKDDKTYVKKPAASKGTTPKPATPSPSPAAQTPAKSPKPVPIAERAAVLKKEFESHYGVVFRSFDDTARTLDVSTTARTTGIRKLFVELKQSVDEWLGEVVARGEREAK